MAQDLILALDQGTTSTRAILFDRAGTPLGEASRPLRQSYPADGWVEHDAEEIYAAAVAVLREVTEASGRTADIAAIGVTNQRETVVVWDRATGRPIHPAIVWQDRRTADVCARLKAEGHEPKVTEVTGLLLDPYFSATKIAWILDKVPGARARAEAGELLCGTMDCWVIWRLTGGAVHATDATNASRTLLFDIGAQAWSSQMMALFDVPSAILPTVLDCVDDYGATRAEILGREIPIRGVAGDQQAALMGQGCVAPGQMKATYGTGCFMLINTGTDRAVSRARLLTTVAARVEARPTMARPSSASPVSPSRSTLKVPRTTSRSTRWPRSRATRMTEDIFPPEAFKPRSARKMSSPPHSILVSDDAPSNVIMGAGGGFFHTAQHDDDSRHGAARRAIARPKRVAAQGRPQISDRTGETVPQSGAEQSMAAMAAAFRATDPNLACLTGCIAMANTAGGRLSFVYTR